MIHRPIVTRLLCLVNTLATFVLPRSAPAEESPLDREGTQWAPHLEWSLKNATYEGNPFDLPASVTFVHEGSGEKRTTGMFYDGDDTWKFRFTGTRIGRWTFVTSSADPELNGRRGTVMIKPHPNRDIPGFVAGSGDKWIRTGTGRAFVPQLVMYAAPKDFYRKPEKIDADIRTFLVEHGFNGFHVTGSCHWFDINAMASGEIRSADPNPDRRTFEALELLITKTHAAGGMVHLWAWGDDSRKWTPTRWGKNGRVDQRLQRTIAARLGPLPGWTMGYGFDNWEWVTEDDLRRWHEYLHRHMGWPHLLGARAQQNRLTQIYDGLDYSGYEQHRPDYEKYVETIMKRPEKPSFSEDRFRIRESSRYASKDYDMERTRRGLWHSTMAGGVANIWGCLSGRPSGPGSSPYPHPEWIKTWSTFFEKRFLKDMTRANELTDGVCLKRPTGRHFVFYKESATSIQMDLSRMNGLQPAVAVDTRRPYSEVELGDFAPKKMTWTAPYRSDWAIALGDSSQRPTQEEARVLKLDLDGSLEAVLAEGPLEGARARSNARGRTVRAELGPGARFVPSLEGQGVEPGEEGPAIVVPVPDDLWRSKGTLAFRFRSSRRLSYDRTRDRTRATRLVESPVLTVQLRERYNLTSMDLTVASGDTSRSNRGQLLLSHLKPERWYHTAIAWDAENGQLEVYLNGVLQQNPRGRDRMGGWMPAARPSGALELGGLLGEGASVARLAIDSVCLYDRFLGEDEVRGELDGRHVDPLEGEGRTDYSGALDLAGYQRTLLFEADFRKPLDHVHESALFEGERRTRLPTGRDWVLEGSGRAWTEDGSLHVETTGDEGGGHLVLWNTRVFPENVLVEWEFSPEDPDTGLTIIFFAARPVADPGGSIFDLNLPRRYGFFKNYHSVALDSYHSSYWAPPRRTANLRKNHGFLLPSCGIDRIAGHGPGPHRVRLLKYGGRIRLESRGRLALAFDDDGKSYGPVLKDGYIGLRQMAHSHHIRYTSFRVWKLERRP